VSRLGEGGNPFEQEEKRLCLGAVRENRLKGEEIKGKCQNATRKITNESRKLSRRVQCKKKILEEGRT